MDNSMYGFLSMGRAALLAALAIVVFGIFPDLRPSFEVDGESVSVDMTTTIVLLMFVVGVIILAAWHLISGRLEATRKPVTPVPAAV